MSASSLGPSVPPAGQNPAPRLGATSIADYAARMSSPRNVLFLFLVTASLFVFWTPLRTLLDYSMRTGHHEYDRFSHTLLIPLISMVLMFLQRKRIFARVQHGISIGGILLLMGLTLNWCTGRALNQLGAENSLSTEILGLIIFWIGGFIFCYGTGAFRAGAFPLLLLLLTVPIPDSLLDAPIWAVRLGSTEVCSAIFTLANVPVLRNGFELTLPGNSIQVAKECSGIHSTLAIFIISLIAGHLFLPSVWKKVVLVFFALPIVCVTNGLRIALLTLLAEYVDASFLHGSLHHKGGTGFFLLALLLLFAILQVLRRGQGRMSLRAEFPQNGDQSSASLLK